MWFKLLLFVLVCVFMVIINVGGEILSPLDPQP
jgi:hypothetical protein